MTNPSFRRKSYSLKNNKDSREPQAASPTPLRDWIHSQNPKTRVAGVLLFAIMIGCGALAPASLPLSFVPGSQQLLFVLLAGAVLGSNLGAAAALIYLGIASFTGNLWPRGIGPDALTGPISGFLWSLPVTAYLSGYAVERWRGEKPAHYAIGVCAGIAAYHAFGTLRLVSALDGASIQAFMSGAGIYLGQHIAQAALAVLIASTASDLARAREQK